VDEYGVCAYDCRRLQLFDFCGLSPVMPFPVPRDGDQEYTILKNHLFVLKEDGNHDHPWHPSSTYSIIEFSAQMEAAEWVKVKTYEFKPLERPRTSDYLMDIHATQDFLLVVATNMEKPPYYHQLAWLYDNSSGTWRDIPGIPNDERSNMCELRWNVAP
jgi:hypothetical protein